MFRNHPDLFKIVQDKLYGSQKYWKSRMDKVIQHLKVLPIISNLASYINDLPTPHVDSLRLNLHLFHPYSRPLKYFNKIRLYYDTILKDISENFEGMNDEELTPNNIIKDASESYWCQTFIYGIYGKGEFHYINKYSGDLKFLTNLDWDKKSSVRFFLVFLKSPHGDFSWLSNRL